MLSALKDRVACCHLTACEVRICGSKPKAAPLMNQTVQIMSHAVQGITGNGAAVIDSEQYQLLSAIMTMTHHTDRVSFVWFSNPYFTLQTHLPTFQEFVVLVN